MPNTKPFLSHKHLPQKSSNPITIESFLFPYLFLVLIWLPIESFAQYEYLRFNVLSIENGLGSPGVFDVIQDQQGFIWMITMDELVRYDGYELTAYQYERDSIASLNTVYEDSKGRLWVGGIASKGRIAALFQFDRNSKKFIPYLFQPDEDESGMFFINSLIENEAGQLVVNTIDDGLWVLNVDEVERQNLAPLDISKKNYVYDSNNNQSLVSNNTWVTQHEMAMDKEGNLWIPNSMGLVKFDSENEIFETFKYVETLDYHPDNQYQQLFLENENTLWVGGVGLFQFDLKTEKFINFYQHQSNNPFSLPHENVNVIFKDNIGRIWVNTGSFSISTVSLFNPETGNFRHTVDNFLTKNNEKYFPVRAAFLDFSGSVWLTASSEGVYYHHLDVGKFRFFHPNPDLNTTMGTNVVTCILEDSEGDIWMGLQNKSLTQWNKKEDTFVHYAHQANQLHTLKSNELYSLLEDEQQNLWIGGDKTLYLMDKETGTFDALQISEYSMQNVLSLAEDDKGKIWAAVFAKGLVRVDDFEKGEFTVFDKAVMTSTKDTVALANPMGILKEPNTGLLWLYSDSYYLYKIQPDKASIEALPIANVQTMYFDSQNRCWLATAMDGLSLFDTKNNQKLWSIPIEKPAERNVKGIVEDNAGFLWYMIPEGLVKFDPNSKKIINRYSFKNWINLDNEWFDITMSAIKTQEGRLIFNTKSGVLDFHPDSIQMNNIPPKIVLTDFKLFNETVEVGEDAPLQQDIAQTHSLNLAHFQNDLSFEVAALHFKNPASNQYAHWLEGYDKDWRHIGTQRNINYTNLNPGSYKLKIRVANSDGVWTEQPLELPITIFPPWYQTWWAYLLWITLTAAAIYALYRYQLNRRLEQAEAQRIKDLDTLKTHLYTNITHEFRTPLTIILGVTDQLREKLKGYYQDSLNMITRNGNQLLQLVNQMLDLNKLEAGQMELQLVQGDVIVYLKYLVESFHSMAKAKDIDLQFESEIEELMMDYDPIRLQQVVMNLLSNAIKFTETEGEVMVFIGQKKVKALQELSPLGYLSVQVKDTGIGISKEKLPHIFDRFYQVNSENGRDTWSANPTGTGIGLALTRELVKLMNGTIEVESELGQGSIFTLTLPIFKKAETPKVESAFAKQLTSIDFLSSSEHELIFNEKKKKNLPHVLIIEDNADVTQYLASTLETHYHITTAANGERGIEVALELIPDLIISDVMMPKKDGYEVCQTLKNDERTSHIPIIMLTAKADFDSKMLGLSRGADAYLPKPFNKKELLLRIEKLLELRQKMQTYYAAKFGKTTASKSITIPVKPPPKLDAEQEAFLNKVKDLIEQNLNNPTFSVEEMTKVLAMSSPQLFRKLKALTGFSAKQLMQQMRLDKAKALLKETDLSIVDIAYQTGFTDPNYFSRIFKKINGVKPSQFRNL